MLEGKYWVVYGGELLGVTDDEDAVKRVLTEHWLTEGGYTEDEIPGLRKRLGLRLKFDSYRLTLDNAPLPGYYAVNAQEL